MSAPEPVTYDRPEIEQDEGDVTIRAFTSDTRSVMAIVVKRNCVYVTDATLDTTAKVAKPEKFDHHAFRPTGPRVVADAAHPLLEKMARALTIADGYDPDDHWTDYDPWEKDLGGPAWTFYTQHAVAALKVLQGLDEKTLWTATAALNYDADCPIDAAGDEDYAPDFGRCVDHMVAVAIHGVPQEEQSDG